MARFFLHLRNRVGFVRDEEGEELPDLDAARQLALESIRDILSQDVKDGLVDLRGRIEITDGGDEVLAVVPFSEAVELRLDECR